MLRALLPLGSKRPARAVPSRKAGEESDASLVVRALAGDVRAEEAIYRRYVRYVGGMIARMLGPQADAEDALQETFTIALERLSSLRDQAALRSWLAQIAVSRVQRRFRRRRLLRLLRIDRASDEALLESLAADDSDPELRAELVALGRALGRLPDAQRIAWSLHYIEGHTLEETAHLCKCSLATIKRRLAAAHARVRAAVELEEVSP